MYTLGLYYSYFNIFSIWGNTFAQLRENACIINTHFKANCCFFNKYIVADRYKAKYRSYRKETWFVRFYVCQITQRKSDIVYGDRGLYLSVNVFGPRFLLIYFKLGCPLYPMAMWPSFYVPGGKSVIFSYSLIDRNSRGISILSWFQTQYM